MSDLSRLSAYFDPSDIEWKPGATTKDRSKGLAMAYITNRAIQQRLDDVCGPSGWRNEYREGPAGGVLCGLSIYCKMPDERWEWVTKWDGADNSKVEATKGGLSDSMKRAGYQWGIGRYLYQLDSQWVPLDERGRFRNTPPIPREYLPGPPKSEPRKLTSKSRAAAAKSASEGAKSEDYAQKVEGLKQWVRKATPEKRARVLDSVIKWPEPYRTEATRVLYSGSDPAPEQS